MVLLPPSETKTAGGDGAPLKLDQLSFGKLRPVRRRLLTALISLAADVPASLAALGLSPRQTAEVARNARLRRAPTLPALARYTGVLYDALDVPSLSTAQRRRADERLVVASALFGLVRGGDPIPAYRLSAGSTLPGLGGLRRTWRPALEPLLRDRDELVVDLRSGAYAALAPAPCAVAVRVLSTDAAGKRKAVSHHNKAYKGRLARELARTVSEPATVHDLIMAARGAGILLEQTGERELDLHCDR